MLSLAFGISCFQPLLYIENVTLEQEISFAVLAKILTETIDTQFQTGAKLAHSEDNQLIDKLPEKTPVSSAQQIDSRINKQKHTI